MIKKLSFDQNNRHIGFIFLDIKIMSCKDRKNKRYAKRENDFRFSTIFEFYWKIILIWKIQWKISKTRAVVVTLQKINKKYTNL